MKESQKLRIILYFTIFYLIFFTIFSIIIKNYEFIFYSIILSLLVIFIALYYKKLHLHVGVISGLTIIGIMHVLGGNIFISGTRLYDVWFIANIIRYDNIVHFVGIFVATLVAYSLLYPHLDKKLKHNKVLLSIILILIATGMGTLNEVVELFAVVFLDAAKGVGDYMNNAKDLLFNIAGAISASIYLMFYHKKQEKKKK